MNFRANKRLQVHMRKLWYYCFFGFTPAIASKVGESHLGGAVSRPVPIGQQEASQPYLTAVGAPPLRFEEPVPFPSPAAPDAAGAARDPASPKPPAPRPAPSAPAGPAAAQQKTLPAPASSTRAAGQPASPDSAQPSIIPDEMRPRVRPEEFLPFFQLPGQGAPSAPAPNPPATLPPSTATYRTE
jgi:translation initiation factor IF-2